MSIIIAIMGIMLLAAMGFIFWLLKVLKNTFEIADSAINFAMDKPSRKYGKAYDGKYYPATVISQLKFNHETTMVITDFSLYDSKKIVGFTLYTPESAREFMEISDDDDITDEELNEIIESPTVFKNVLVYAPKEGMWAWKSAE